jgi:HEAT repeat protein
MDKDFDEALAKAIASGDEVPEAVLEGLSGLGGVALRRFHDVWERLDPDRRAYLLDRLGELGESNLALDFQHIYVAALADRDASVRERALKLAAAEPSPALLETFLRAAIADSDEDVRLSAVEALGQFALTAQTDDWPPEAWRQIETALVGVLRLPSADPTMRRAALLSVAYLTTGAVETEIRQAFRDQGLRDAAIEAMGRNCQPLWIPDLSDALDDEDAAIREVAVEAAAELEDEALVPRLLPRLDDDDDEVRLATIAALGTIGGPVAKEALTELLTSTDRQNRDAARVALEALLDEENPLSA